MIRFPLCLLAVVLLAGCANVPPPYQGRDYSSMPPERLRVSSVLIDNEYMAPEAEPHVEHLYAPSMVDVLSEAIQAHYPRLVTHRDQGVELRFVIKEASIVETAHQLPEHIFDRWMYEGPEFTYDARLVVEALASAKNSRRTAFASAEVSRTLDVGQMSPAARARQVQGLIEHMVDDAMDELGTQLDQTFGSLRYGDGSNDQTVMPEPSGRWDKVMNWE